MFNRITEELSLTNIEKNIIAEIADKQLWGDLDVLPEEYEILRIRISDLLAHPGVGIDNICRQYPCAFVTLLVALVRYKYDYNFWGLLGEELSIMINGPIETKIGAYIRKTFTKYGFDFSDVKTLPHVNLEPIFYEAGLPPESSLDDLFYVLNYDTHTIFDPQLIVEDLLAMRSYQIRKPLLRFLSRFKEDRALEFVLEVHDAMLCVDQNHAVDSRYVGNYIEWKKKQSSKEVINARKKQEFQTRPYLAFENGKRGLCMVLPRIILQNEWLEDVQWNISGDDELSVQRNVLVFGNDGCRYVESITVPVSPSRQYCIQLIDNEGIEEEAISEWTIDGIKRNDIAFFNANGRLINGNYLPVPYGIMIVGEDVSFVESNHLVIQYQAYPTDTQHYSVRSCEPNGKNAQLIYQGNRGKSTLIMRPQIDMSFEGKTLFSVSDENYRLFTNVPSLIIDVDEDVIVDGIEVRIGNQVQSISKYFKAGHAVISLKNRFGISADNYGTYSVRLYQNGHFLKQIEFCIVPKIKTSYSAVLEWPDKKNNIRYKRFTFEKGSNWELEFEDCKVKSSETNYTVECSSDKGVLVGLLRYERDSHTFSCKFELPINPFEIEIIDGSQIMEDEGHSVKRITLADVQNREYWLSLKCFGVYRNREYSLRLHTANGIEQVHPLSVAHNNCGNCNLTIFYDTLNTCPLPAQLEVWCDGDETLTYPIFTVLDEVVFAKRPLYSTKQNYLIIQDTDGQNDLVIRRFGKNEIEYSLHYANSKLAKDGVRRGYKCPEILKEGLYVVSGEKAESIFDYEEESGVVLSNETDTFYVSNRDKQADMRTVSDWLDQLIQDILRTGANKDIAETKSSLLTKTHGKSTLDGKLSAEDYVRLISLAYFTTGKVLNSKKLSIIKCMQWISKNLLDADDRLELIRTLAALDCPSEIFDICLQQYNLYLFATGSGDAKNLAQVIENHSIELSMLLRMGADDSVHNTVWREKYRELIGKEAIRQLLSVPTEQNPKLIAEAQKAFLREQKCSVKINLTKDISGDMQPITDMVKTTYNKAYLDLSKKPDIGVYFDHIRYVDQYINWYTQRVDKEFGLLEQETRDLMNQTVQSYAKLLMKSIAELKKIPKSNELVSRYEYAIRARYEKNPLESISSCIPARYFYLQGMAALMAKLPVQYKRYAGAARIGEEFMVSAMAIAPRIARRDLIMASTYIYLIRKEEKLCR